MKRIFEEGIIVSILTVGLIAGIDILASRTLSCMNCYTMAWQSLLFKIGLIMCCIFPVIYYFLIRKDKSETIALFLTSIILWFSGLANVLFFWLQGKAIPMTLPWLNESIIGNISRLIGLPVVTNISLLVSVAIGLVMSLLLDIMLEKIN